VVQMWKEILSVAHLPLYISFYLSKGSGIVYYNSWFKDGCLIGSSTMLSGRSLMPPSSEQS
jgi:hypothetical protein